MQTPHTVTFRGSTPGSPPQRWIVRLDPDALIPQFEQLRAQISVMVAVGRLQPASRLPTIRELAAQLDLAPGTVARAYRELEREGLVVGRGRQGTFVADEPPHSEPLLERQRRLADAASRYADEARQLGVDGDSALEAVREALVAPLT